MPIAPVPLPADSPVHSAASIPMDRRPRPASGAHREPRALPHPATRLHESRHQTPVFAAHPRPVCVTTLTLADKRRFGKSWTRQGEYW